MLPVKFDPPISVNGKTMSSVNMRPPTIGDEEDAQAMAVDLGRAFTLLTSEICVLSIITGIPYDDIRRLPTYQYQTLRDAYAAVNVRPTKKAGKREPLPVEAVADSTGEPAPENPSESTEESV